MIPRAAVVLFTRDLRVHDHAGPSEAARIVDHPEPAARFRHPRTPGAFTAPGVRGENYPAAGSSASSGTGTPIPSATRRP